MYMKRKRSYCCLLRCLSHFHTNKCTRARLISPGNISTASARKKNPSMEQMAALRVKPPTTIPTTSPTPHLPTLSFTDCNPPGAFRFAAATSSMTSRLEVPAREARARREPCGAAQSQPRGEEKGGGEAEGGEPSPEISRKRFKLFYF